MRRTRAEGFTLVELLVTIAIVAILAAIAFPNFQATIRSNRIATTANEFMGAMALARSEALRSPGGAQVCASSDGANCNGISWNDGWLVWSDVDRSGTLTTGADSLDRVVRYSQSKPGLTLAPGNASVLAIAFDQRGRNRTGATTFTLRPADCPAGVDLVRTITVTVTGETRLVREACSAN